MMDERTFGDELIGSQRHLHAFGRLLCRDAALVEDLVQQTLLQAWAARHRRRFDGCVRSWLFTILRNCYYAQLRIRRRELRVEIEDAHGEIAKGVAPSAGEDLKGHMVELSRALQALPSEQREALTLVIFRGFSYAEVARMCRCKEGTVKSRVSRARKALIRLREMGRVPRRIHAANALEPRRLAH